MADTKITALPAAGTLALTDIIPCVALGGPTTQKATLTVVRTAMLPIALGGTEVSGTLPAAKVAPGANTQVLTTTGGVAVWAAPAAGGSPPTGTGFVTVTGGVQDAAALVFPLASAKGGLGASAAAFTGLLKFAAGVASAATLVDADVAAGAAVAGSKIAPNFGAQLVQSTGNAQFASYLFGAAGPTITQGTGVPATTPANGSLFMRTDGTGSTGLYTRQAAAWTAIGGGSTSPAGATDEVQINNAGAFGAATNVTAGTSFVSVGPTPALTGAVRLANLGKIVGRNLAGTADIMLAQIDNNNFVYVGNSTNAAVLLDSPGQVTMRNNGTNILTVLGTVVTTAQPIKGDFSPFAMNGHSAVAVSGATNVVVAAADYSNSSNVFTGALTAGITATYPAATDAGAYYKWCQNSTTGGFAITVGMGTGTTVALGAGGAPRLIRFNAAGALLVV